MPSLLRRRTRRGSSSSPAPRRRAWVDIALEKQADGDDLRRAYEAQRARHAAERAAWEARLAHQSELLDKAGLGRTPFPYEVLARAIDTLAPAKRRALCNLLEAKRTCARQDARQDARSPTALRRHSPPAPRRRRTPPRTR